MRCAVAVPVPVHVPVCTRVMCLLYLLLRHFCSILCRTGTALFMFQCTLGIWFFLILHTNTAQHSNTTQQHISNTTHIKHSAENVNLVNEHTGRARAALEKLTSDISFLHTQTRHMSDSCSLFQVLGCMPHALQMSCVCVCVCVCVCCVLCVVLTISWSMVHVQDVKRIFFATHASHEHASAHE